MEKDFKDTLNLPKTKFPMRANLPKKEPEILNYYEQIDIYKYLLKEREGKQKFVLHDGPPYANGKIHIGHALNKILKDIINKFYILSGYQVPYIPGWDCHGLPIEHKVFEKLKKKKHEVDPLTVRKLCREYASHFIEVQKKDFIRLGVIGDWKNPYITMDAKYQANIARELGKFYEKELVYKGKRIVHWCPNCVTALADAEIEYKEKESPSIFVAFPSKDEKNTYYVIWTTTPWTLPANIAIAVNPEFDYVYVEKDGKIYVFEKELFEKQKENLGFENVKIIKEVKGKDLEGKRYYHPFINREGIIVLGNHVTKDAGTGLVHTAPGHGEEDFEVAKVYNLPVLMFVDDNGVYREDLYKQTEIKDNSPVKDLGTLPEELKNMHIKKANSKVLEILREKGLLIKEEKIKHSYPHCWRCKKEVIFRATDQWFISLDKLYKTLVNSAIKYKDGELPNNLEPPEEKEDTLRSRALIEIGKVTWYPPQGENRISSMVKERPDWCISRQRYWGVPIIAFYCKNCGKLIFNREIVEHVANIFENYKDGDYIGADAWYALTEKELLPKDFKCPYCSSQEFKKEMDILDVWFDSGSSHACVLEQREEFKDLKEFSKKYNYPIADMYLEGSDQHRGWFQASLLESCGTRGRAPYKSVLTHGFILDEQGRKMSKSLGNVVEPQKVIEKFGADILRLWTIFEDFSSDTKISENILRNVAETYKKIRNTIRYLLGNLSDFNPEKDKVPYEKLLDIDKWALSRFTNFAKRVLSYYRNYELHKIYKESYEYIANELSAIYLDVQKDTLYCEKKDSLLRRSCQTVLWELLKGITLLLAPILSFTMEDVYINYIKDFNTKEFGEKKSIFAHTFDEVIKEEYINYEIEKEFEILLKVKKDVNKILEDMRQKKIISHNLEADVELYAPEDIYKVLEKYYNIPKDYNFLAQFLGVSKVKLSKDKEYIVDVKKAEGKKCPRCWVYSLDYNEDGLCKRCQKVLND